eukprot:CAMPEP_0173131086 /NCGR_PEP_ID=MMETSP1102-20130122/60429_1 /TAXON_ID=49646 /ORGANISM="Geminigera sp., Strain Caron Lab Isolate" /LENGTH=486 /DNA_ID=CAMNT_0014042331 /DNA_START=312 /DNA_END=1772 /DNA_ORIENTATION=-
MSNADTVQLLELGAGLLEQLSCEANTTAAMQVFDFASRQPDLSTRLLEQGAFRTALEHAAAATSEGPTADAQTQTPHLSNTPDGSTRTRVRTNCCAALRLLLVRSQLRKEQRLECVTGGYIRILEDRGFGAQATCKQDGTLKTGGVVWEAAHCLVDVMHRLGAHSFCGKSVLELGAGCGYVGIVAARMGAVVTVTDRADHLDHLQHNVNLNDLQHSMRVAELEWDQPFSSGLSSNSFDWILASDCVYEQDSHRPLAQTLCAFANPNGSVLISQETRSETHTSFFRHGTPLPTHTFAHQTGEEAMEEEEEEEEEEAFVHFAVRQVEDSAFRRPSCCHNQQEIRIFCLSKEMPTLAQQAAHVHPIPFYPDTSPDATVAESKLQHVFGENEGILASTCFRCCSCRGGGRGTLQRTKCGSGGGGGGRESTCSMRGPADVKERQLAWGHIGFLQLQQHVRRCHNRQDRHMLQQREERRDLVGVDLDLEELD